MSCKWKYLWVLMLSINITSLKAQKKKGIDIWITNPDKSALFSKQKRVISIWCKGKCKADNYRR